MQPLFINLPLLFEDCSSVSEKKSSANYRISGTGKRNALDYARHAKAAGFTDRGRR